MLARRDVEADLLRGDPEELRDAFDALVAWDGASAMDGAASAEDVMAVFERVCTALLGDDGRVLRETARALLRKRSGSEAGSVATYGAAARFALAARRTWWTDFAASFTTGG